MARGVTGCEDEVRKLIRNEIKPYVDEIKYDALGSIIAYKKGNEKKPKIMIAAHMDEVGIIITGINKDGTLNFEASGGIDAKIPGSKYIYIGKNRILGVIRMFNAYETAYIDIGTSSEEESKRIVKVGDYGSFTTEFEKIGDEYVKSKALDDRMGCMVLMEILKNKYDVPIYGVFSVQEEIGERGAFAASYLVQPDIGIVLEGTVCSDVTVVEPYRHSTTLGGGPAVSIADRTTYFDIGLSEGICKIARENDVPHQRRRITGGGNDGGAIHITGKGARCITLSVPCRYIHSPICVTSLKDFENTVKLLDLFLKEIENGGIK